MALDKVASDNTVRGAKLDTRNTKLNDEANRLRGIKAELEAVRAVKI